MTYPELHQLNAALKLENSSYHEHLKTITGNKDSTVVTLTRHEDYVLMVARDTITGLSVDQKAMLYDLATDVGYIIACGKMRDDIDFVQGVQRYA